jgi:hypothetical protein
MSFVCLIEDEQVSEQRGEESRTNRGAKDGLTQKRLCEVEGDTKQFLGIR